MRVELKRKTGLAEVDGQHSDDSTRRQSAAGAGGRSTAQTGATGGQRDANDECEEGRTWRLLLGASGGSQY